LSLWERLGNAELQFGRFFKKKKQQSGLRDILGFGSQPVGYPAIILRKVEKYTSFPPRFWLFSYSAPILNPHHLRTHIPLWSIIGWVKTAIFNVSPPLTVRARPSLTAKGRGFPNEERDE